MSNIKVELKKQDVDKIREICRSFNDDAGELINVLHKTQGTFGYLPAEVQEGVWCGNFLFFLFHDPERKIPHFDMHGNSMLCAGSGKCSGGI